MNLRVLLSIFSSLFFSAAALAADVVQLESPWSRATAPGARTGAVFMGLRAAAGDRLLAADSEFAERTELHEHRMENAMVSMRKVDAIAVPAGGFVELKPGGFHLMLINLKAPLVAGTQIPLRLTFEKAGTVNLSVSVQSPGTMSAGGGGHALGHPVEHGAPAAGQSKAEGQRGH